jgi:hypothetical protein
LKYFEAIKALFSRSRAFELFVNNNKRKLIKGFSFLPAHIRNDIELVYFDLFPDTTRFPEKWEDVFAVLFRDDELEKRRDILDSLWKINKGGQAWPFLETILQSLDENIKVIENIPLRNPRDSNVAYISVNFNKNMCNGNKRAINSCRTGDSSFVPVVLQNDVSGRYAIPNDPAFWEMCFFVCKSVVRNSRNEITYIERLQINKKWQNYIEYMILKIKPLQSTAVIFIEWTED